MIFETIHQALITHTGVYISLFSKLLEGIDIAIAVYTYTVTNWGNSDDLEFKIVW
jgi:hypothetical protein